MIMGIIILIISLFLNNYILTYLPYNIGNLSLFTPMFFIVSLVLIYPYFKDGVDYLGGINKFIDELNSYYDKGKPLSSRNDTLDEYGNVVKGYNPPYLVAFIGAIAVSSIVVSINL